jgi:hypothetical protein
MDCPDVCLEAFWLQEWEWVLEDCHKRSCWRNSIGVSVPRPCGSHAYVRSKSCRLCLTVVYWLLECNEVPSWIENPRVRYSMLRVNLKRVRFQVLTPTSMKLAAFWGAAPILSDVSQRLTASITSSWWRRHKSSETSVNFYRTTWRNIPQDIHLLVKHVGVGRQWKI